LAASARAEGSGVEVESALGEFAQDVDELGEAPVALLREDELVVDQHVELALRAGGHLGGVRRAVQLGYETRSPFVIAASDGAVKDSDVGHRI